MSNTAVRLVHRTLQPSLEDIANQIVSSFGQADVIGSRAYIHTPIVLPSGVGVVIVVEKISDSHFRLTDLKLGYEAAADIGLEEFYTQEVMPFAENNGLTCSENELSLSPLNANELPGATTVLASAVLRVLERCFVKRCHASKSANQDASITQPDGFAFCF